MKRFLNRRNGNDVKNRNDLLPATAWHSHTSHDSYSSYFFTQSRQRTGASHRRNGNDGKNGNHDLPATQQHPHASHDSYSSHLFTQSCQRTGPLPLWNEGAK